MEKLSPELTRCFPRTAICKILRLSSSHVTREDGSKLLSLEDDCPFLQRNHDYGTEISIAPEEDYEAIELCGFSEALMRIVHAAREQNIDYIDFDCDGNVFDWLPVFDW